MCNFIILANFNNFVNNQKAQRCARHLGHLELLGKKGKTLLNQSHERTLGAGSAIAGRVSRNNDEMIGSAGCEV